MAGNQEAIALGSGVGLSGPTGRVGKYVPLARIGGGGMAEVYLAVAPGPGGFNKLLVLKIMHRALAEEPEFVEMFQNEARLAARINHPNAVQTYEVGAEGDLHYLVMEYLEGCSLGQLRKATRRKRSETLRGGRPSKPAGDYTGESDLKVSERESFTLEQHIKIIHDALSGLHNAHTLTDYDGSPLHLVHRDVTSQNIFITYDGQVKVLDFGIAKATTTVTRTRSGVLKGTIRYMSPEAMLGHPLDHRADLYSVGVLLWEAATGKSMWKGSPEAVVMREVSSGNIPDVASANPDVPSELARIVGRALAFEPEQRYQDAQELQDDLEAFLLSRGNPKPRDLAATLNRQFGGRRARTARMINTQLEKLESAGMDAVAQASSPFSIITLPGAKSQGSASGVTGTPTAPATTLTDLLLSTSHTRRKHQSNPSNHRWKLAMLIAFVGLALGAAFVLLSSPSEQTQPSPAPREMGTTPEAATGKANAQPVEQEASLVSVTIHTRPSGARISFDGKNIGAAPQTFSHKRDAVLYTIVASAPGFRDKSIAVTLDKDVDLTLQLERDTSSQPDSRPRTQKAESKDAAAKSKRDKKGLSLDAQNPWQ